MSNPFDPLDNEVTNALRALNEVNRINDAMVTHVNRMVEDAVRVAKPMQDAVQEAVAKVEAARPMFDEAARIFRQQTAGIDRAMRQGHDMARAMMRHMETVASVTRNRGYRW